jgi:peptidoglycan glycosyltransferase
MKSRIYYPTKWRKNQARFQRSARIKHYLGKLPLYLAISGGTLAALVLLFLAGHKITEYLSRSGQKNRTSETNLNLRPQALSRKDLPQLLSRVTDDPSELADKFVVEKDGMRFMITTTIDAGLQEYVVRLLARANSLQAAVVVLNPFDGQVLAIASQDSLGREANLPLKADFPAASLFKIVSAAAALETAGFTPDKEIFFVGRRHTLYKDQLKPTQARSRNQTTFRKAFASSNNSVFGKLGIYTLGQKVMVEYADKFFFNKLIPFDLPAAVSTVEVPEGGFGLAEIASGFNKRTMLSPLHAALLASAVVNKGNMAVPWLVDTIRDDADKVIYHARSGVLSSPISRKTAEELKVLMEDAALYGTASKAFRRLRRVKRFSDFDLGAKTGTINDKGDHVKYDWIIAYALTPDRAKGICISVVSVHGKRLGIRSTELARAIISYYFSS